MRSKRCRHRGKYQTGGAVKVMLWSAWLIFAFHSPFLCYLNRFLFLRVYTRRVGVELLMGLPSPHHFIIRTMSEPISSLFFIINFKAFGHSIWLYFRLGGNLFPFLLPGGRTGAGFCPSFNILQLSLTILYLHLIYLSELQHSIWYTPSCQASSILMPQQISQLTYTVIPWSLQQVSEIPIFWRQTKV
jgi:hypothetical protein